MSTHNQIVSVLLCPKPADAYNLDVIRLVYAFYVEENKRLINGQGLRIEEEKRAYRNLVPGCLWWCFKKISFVNTGNSECAILILALAFEDKSLFWTYKNRTQNAILLVYKAAQLLKVYSSHAINFVNFCHSEQLRLLELERHLLCNKLKTITEQINAVILQVNCLNNSDKILKKF